MAENNSSAPLKTAGEPFVALGECIADQVCLSVAELPDRDSPADWPQAMLVTSEELRNIVLNAINYAAQAVAAQAAPAAVAVPDHVYTLRVNGRLHDYTPTLIAFDLCDGEHKLYTEQQVRDLINALPATEDSSAGDLAEEKISDEMSREERMIVLQRDSDGTPTVWCDPEIADIVCALNSGGVKTVASCSGHGVKPGGIALADGRQILLLESLEAFNSAMSAITQAVVQAEPVAWINHPVIVDSAGNFAGYGHPELSFKRPPCGFAFDKAQALYTAPQAQPADALDAWQAIGSMPTCDDLIWLYCQDTNTIDGPVAPHPMYEDSWTHWAYAQAPSTATIDAAMAAAQEGGNAAKEV